MRRETVSQSRRGGKFQNVCRAFQRLIKIIVSGLRWMNESSCRGRRVACYIAVAAAEPALSMSNGSAGRTVAPPARDRGDSRLSFLRKIDAMEHGGFPVEISSIQPRIQKYEESLVISSG